MIIDPAPLFVEVELPAVYQGLDNELEAVAAGRKCLSVFTFEGADGESDPNFVIVPDVAARLGLAVTRVRRENGLPPPWSGTVSVCITRAYEAWRGPAYVAVLETLMTAPWSDVSERVQSALLGYSDAEFAAWIGAWRASRAGWGPQIHLWLDAARAAGVGDLGRRAFAVDVGQGPLPVFIHRRRMAVAAGWFERVPRGWALARAVVARDFHQTLFGRRVDWGAAEFRFAAVVDVVALNGALRSGIQVLGAAGWEGV